MFYLSVIYNGTYFQNYVCSCFRLIITQFSCFTLYWSILPFEITWIKLVIMDTPSDLPEQLLDLIQPKEFKLDWINDFKAMAKLMFPKGSQLNLN